MTYGLSRGLFLEDGPAIHAAEAAAARSQARFRSWRSLEPEQRLVIVERAMGAPANDLIDDFPIAL